MIFQYTLQSPNNGVSSKLARFRRVRVGTLLGAAMMATSMFCCPEMAVNELYRDVGGGPRASNVAICEMVNPVASAAIDYVH